jgi:hypothetical protein
MNFKEGDTLKWKRTDCTMTFPVMKNSNDGKLYINNGYGTMVLLDSILRYKPVKV